MAVAAGALSRPGAGFPLLGPAATAALVIGHAGALVYSARSRSPLLTTAVVVLTVLLVIVQIGGRPSAGRAWIYRMGRAADRPGNQRHAPGLARFTGPCSWSGVSP